MDDDDDNNKNQWILKNMEGMKWNNRLNGYSPKIVPNTKIK